MNPRLAHLLVCLYPRPWRERYGAEFEALLQTGRGDLRASANVVWSALHEYVFPTPGVSMNQYSVVALTKKPSAFLPLAMSLTALAVVLGHVAMFGVAHEADEGPLPISGSYSWLDRCRYWRSSPSSGCHELQDRRCLYLHCKPELRSHPWPPSFFSNCEWGFLSYAPCLCDAAGD